MNEEAEQVLLRKESLSKPFIPTSADMRDLQDSFVTFLKVRLESLPPSLPSSLPPSSSSLFALLN